MTRPPLSPRPPSPWAALRRRLRPEGPWATALRRRLRPEGPWATALRRAAHPLYRRLETDVHPLRYVFLEITRRCNLACRHCGSDCDRRALPGELSTDEWLGVCDELARDFPPGQLAVVLTGGEPLCHPELGRILERLQHHRLRWGLVTNGWQLTERNVARLRAFGMATLTVSLDGLSAQHDWLRGRDGAYHRAEAGLRHLSTAGLRYFDVVTCVHPGNLAELPALHQRLRALGVPGWRLFPIFAKGRAAQNQELLLPPSGFTALLRFLADARRQEARWPGPGSSRPGANRARPPMKIDLSCEGYLPPAWDRAVRSEPYFCRAGISVASVLHDGAVGACPNIHRDLIQGNIREASLKDLWEHRFAPYRHRAWLQQGRCRDCAEFSRCQGNSLHLWEPEREGCGACTLELLQSPRP